MPIPLIAYLAAAGVGASPLPADMGSSVLGMAQ